MKFLSSIILSLLILIGCTQSEHTQPTISGSLIEQKWGNCENDSSFATAAVSLRYWNPNITTIQKHLSQYIQSGILTAIDSATLANTPEAYTNSELAASLINKQYLEAKAEYPDMPGCWEVSIIGDSIFTSSKLISYEITNYSYLGGAHPNTYTSFLTFDRKSGEIIPIKSLITKTSDVLQLAEKAFRINQNLSPSDDLDLSGYFLPDDKQFFYPNEMAFTKEGLQFYYNPYEIAPYAQGPIVFTVTYAELGDFISIEKIR